MGVNRVNSCKEPVIFNKVLKKSNNFFKSWIRICFEKNRRIRIRKKRTQIHRSDFCEDFWVSVWITVLFPASPSVNMIYAFLLGLVWGLIPLKGFLGLALFAAFSAGLIYVWFTALQVRVNIIKCFILFD